jgi:phage gpG-like protein
MLSARLDAGKLLADLPTVPSQVIAFVATKMRQVTINLQRHVVQDKLNGQVLNQRSGKLARSIQQDSHTDGDEVVGEVFSSGDVKYAGIHEFGGKTPPHDIVPSKASALAFMLGGKQIFAKIVHHPGSVIPERSYLRSSLADQADEIVEGLKEAAIRGAQQAVSR